MRVPNEMVSQQRLFLSFLDLAAMSPETRTRLFAVITVLVVIPIGLFARSHRAGADPSTLLGFLATYTGDTLWPIMFYFLGRFCFPNAKVISLLAFVLILTLTLEFGQLWKPPWLQYLRRQRWIGFVLGDSFIWSDVICILVGSAVAVPLDFLRLLLVPSQQQCSHEN